MQRLGGVGRRFPDFNGPSQNLFLSNFLKGTVFREGSFLNGFWYTLDFPSLTFPQASHGQDFGIKSCQLAGFFPNISEWNLPLMPHVRAWVSFPPRTQQRKGFQWHTAVARRDYVWLYYSVFQSNFNTLYSHILAALSQEGFEQAHTIDTIEVRWILCKVLKQSTVFVLGRLLDNSVSSIGRVLHVRLLYFYMKVAGTDWETRMFASNNRFSLLAPHLTKADFQRRHGCGFWSRTTTARCLLPYEQVLVLLVAGSRGRWKNPSAMPLMPSDFPYFRP